MLFLDKLDFKKKREREREKRKERKRKEDSMAIKELIHQQSLTLLKHKHQIIEPRNKH